MESQRQLKVSRLIQRDLGELFRKEAVTLAGGGMITVTKVYVTPDLRQAKVYVSIFAVPSKKDTLKKIQSNADQARFMLGRKAGKQIRVIPELVFLEDDSLDYFEKIETLLSE